MPRDGGFQRSYSSAGGGRRKEGVIAPGQQRLLKKQRLPFTRDFPSQ